MPHRNQKRKKAYRWGHLSELIAIILLSLKGYRIVKRRFRCPQGEIDIIAKRNGSLIFVEVKAREQLETALSSILPKQKQRIRSAAEVWLQRTMKEPQLLTQHNFRFDVIVIAPWHLPVHIRNAF